MKLSTIISAALSVVAVQSVNAQILPTLPEDDMTQLRLFKRDPVFAGLVVACNPAAAAWVRAAFHDA
ncbi:hypothetical protein HK102_009018, partial [Quaeritorhiza haematococci]